jgi:hypothetical protein
VCETQAGEAFRAAEGLRGERCQVIDMFWSSRAEQWLQLQLRVGQDAVELGQRFGRHRPVIGEEAVELGTGATQAVEGVE